MLFAVAFFGSIGLIHRGADTSLDLIAGLAVVAALDRILHRGSDWLAGVFTALAFLAGGWPPVLMVLLPIVILGRPGATMSFRLFLPLGAAFALWSLWTIRAASAEVWGAALFLPITADPTWNLATVWKLAGSLLLLGLPWTPLAALAAWPAAREGWTDATRELVRGWVQVGAVALLAGTFIPGVGGTARVVALATLAVLVAVVLDAVWSGRLGPAARRAFLGVALGLGLLAGVLFVALGGYLAAVVAYYRPVAVGLIVVGIGLVFVMPVLARMGRSRIALGALVVLAVSLKLAHWGIYVPEWNYRVSQGPWGRAIGQWAPPSWPLYIVHDWPAELMFHTGHQVRQVPAPEVLQFHDRSRPLYVLLLPSMFEHWPDTAPKILKVREFEDEHGQRRVLARTEGELGIAMLDRSRK